MSTVNPISPPSVRVSRRWLPLLLPVTGFVLVAFGLMWAIQTIGLERIRGTIDAAGPFAPLIYIGIKAATYVFAPLTSGPIQLGSGILFGLWEGVFYTLIGEVIGGTIAFLIARRWGRAAVRRFVGEDGLKRVDAFYHHVGEWRSLVYARLFLFGIYDFLSYAAGLTPIRLRTYILISAVVGFFPTLAAVLLGTLVTEERSGFIALYAVIGVLIALPLLFHRQIRRVLHAAGLLRAVKHADDAAGAPRT
jgi:uncharacterized membrane protein YdjX (TVP38/TMEM64 family)